MTTVKDGSVDSPLSLDSTRQGGKPAVHPTCPVCGQAQCECPPGAQEVVREMMEDAPMPTAETKAAMQEAREIAASLGVTAVAQPDKRRPWERTDWNCARASVTQDGLRCPEDKCRDCPKRTDGVATGGEAQPLYRFLTTADTIEATDEFVDDDCVRWNPPDRWSIGRPYHSAFKTARRKVPAGVKGPQDV